MFLRLAKALKENHSEIEVFLIDFVDGYMAKHAKSGNIALIPLERGKKIQIPDEAIFITQSLQLWRLPDELCFSEKARILLWHLHPMNILPRSMPTDNERQNKTVIEFLKRIIRFAVYSGTEQQCRTLLYTAQKRGGLVFMDQVNFDVACLVNKVALGAPVFVPVPSVGANPKGERISVESTLRCAWVGRLEDFKIPILLYTMKELALESETQGIKIELAIIGSGKEVNRVQALTVDLQRDFQNFFPLLHGEFTTQKLDGFLSENVDLLFAMGTSALEGAKLGIPTVLLDFSYNDVSDGYIFRFLHNTTGFNLGGLISKAHISPGNNSLKSIIKAIQTDATAISAKTKEYFEKNHGIHSVCKKLIEVLRNNSFAFSEIEQLNLVRPPKILNFYIKVRKFFTKKSLRIEP